MWLWRTLFNSSSPRADREGLYLKTRVENSFWDCHESEFVETYSKNFFWTKENFLKDKYCDDLLTWSRYLRGNGQFKQAAIGKGFKKQKTNEVRGDNIFWINEENSRDFPWIHLIYDGLMQIAKKNFYLPIKRFESHLAVYDKGSFYLRHQDLHSEKPGRLVSCVIYLTTCESGQGGDLVLYDEELRPIKIRPEKGRIVVFDSSIEHEVLKTDVERWSLTGWLRSDLHPGIRLLG